MSRIPQSRIIAFLALTAAAMAHAGAMVFSSTPDIDLAGGETARAAEGSSFVNLAEGIDRPKPPEPTFVQPVQAPEVTRSTEPEAATVPVAASVVTAARTTGIEINPAVQKQPAKAQEPVAPRDTDPAPPKLSEAESPDTLRPPVAAKAQPTAVSAAEAQKPLPEPPQAEAKPVAQPRGTSEVNARRGATEARAQKPGGQSRTTGGTAQVQGNAAASTYPALVLRRIERAKRQANVRGVAVVSFSIARDGGLAAVGIARSSGSSRLDQIAVAQVRRAAPFPPPPAGARTGFTVKIKGQ